jgi:hypothetical protein
MINSTPDIAYLDAFRISEHTINGDELEKPSPSNAKLNFDNSLNKCNVRNVVLSTQAIKSGEIHGKREIIHENLSHAVRQRPTHAETERSILSAVGEYGR